MSSFTGLSFVTAGKQCTTLPVYTDTDSGYHLVKDYSCTLQEMSTGVAISSEPFMVGGHKWCIRYYPNGHDPSCADFISVDVYLGDDDVKEVVAAKFEFSFVNQVEKQKPKETFAVEACSFSDEDRSWGSVKFIKRDVLERSTHLKVDCFTIRCDVMVCNIEDADANMYSDIGQQFNNLLENKVGTDVTFEVSSETFVAYRCVLAARCTVFMAQLFGPMMEGTTSSVIQIEDMEAKVFAALLSFIYTDSFPLMEEKADEDVMWLHDLLVAADRYHIKQLKFLCEKQLSENIGVRYVASTLALVEKHHCHILKKTCFNFIQVQSPKCLGKQIASDGWEHMILTYPSILNGFLAELVSSNQKKDEKRKK